MDVWRVHLDEPSSNVFSSSVLSSDEFNRAQRFHFEKDRLHYIRCRSALRFLLGRYLGIPAAELRFEYQPGGKPELAAQPNPLPLRFNVSHSAQLALIAVGAVHRLGIDIEQERSDVDVAALSARFFSARERAALQSLPDHLRRTAFFACWTRKESFLKATGDGLWFPLADFSVTAHPDLDPALEEIRGDTQARKQWYLADLSVETGYRATLAIERSVARVETYAL
ncbi:MAG: 4'-phosphopantetheinyl transferase superfamily protein [Candidatus Korobacteraceae bacterium]